MLVGVQHLQFAAFHHGAQKSLLQASGVSLEHLCDFLFPNPPFATYSEDVLFHFLSRAPIFFIISCAHSSIVNFVWSSLCFSDMFFADLVWIIAINCAQSFIISCAHSSIVNFAWSSGWLKFVARLCFGILDDLQVTFLLAALCHAPLACTTFMGRTKDDVPLPEMSMAPYVNPRASLRWAWYPLRFRFRDIYYAIFLGTFLGTFAAWRFALCVISQMTYTK